MTLEDEMKKEIERLERDLASIENELKLLHDRVLQLLMDKQKKERDLTVLRSHFGGAEANSKKEFQTTLGKL